MRRIIASMGRDSSMRSHDHHYAITSRHGEASHAKERLFICRRAEGAERSAKASTEDSLRAEAVWEETENEVRFRVRNPDEFEPDSFRRKPLEGVEGVAIIIGRLKKEFVPEGGNPRAMVLQAYRFVRKTEKNPDGWTMEKAKEWIDKHEAGRAVDAALRVEENLIALADAPLGESLDLLSCQAGKAESVRVTGFMGSKYLMLGWIESHVPKGAESILDAFSGGANVALTHPIKRALNQFRGFVKLIAIADTQFHIPISPMPDIGNITGKCRWFLNVAVFQLKPHSQTALQNMDATETTLTAFVVDGFRQIASRSARRLER
jgi:hypothetical protein